MARTIKDSISAVKQVFNSKNLELKLIISIRKNDVETAIATWKKMDSSTQLLHQEDFLEVMKLCGNSLDSAKEVWLNTIPELQKLNERTFTELVNQIPEGDSLEELYLGTDAQVVRDTIEEVISNTGTEGKTSEILNIMQENFLDLLYEEWITDENVKQNNPQILTNLIEKINDSDKVEELWKSADPSLQIANTNAFESVLKKVDLTSVWKETVEEVKIDNINTIVEEAKKYENSKINEEIFSLVKDKIDDPNLLYEVWMDADKEIKQNNPEVLAKLIEEIDDSDKIVELWKSTNSNLQIANTNVFETVLKKVNLSDVFKETADEVKMNNINIIVAEAKKYDDNEINQEIFLLVKNEVEKKIKKDNDNFDNVNMEITDKSNLKDSLNLLYEVWMNADEDLRNSNPEVLTILIEGIDNKNKVIELWKASNSSLQINNINSVLKRVRLHEIWKDTSNAVKIANADVIVENAMKYNSEYYNSVVGKMWKFVSEDFQKENITKILESNKSYKAEVWKNSTIRVQEEKIGEMIEVINDSEPESRSSETQSENILNIWGETRPDVQRKYIQNLLRSARIPLAIRVKILGKTDVEMKQENEESIKRLIKVQQQKGGAQMSEIWRATEGLKQFQMDNIVQILEKARYYDQSEIWRNADREIQEQKINDIIRASIKEGSRIKIESIWKETPVDIQRRMIKGIIANEDIGEKIKIEIVKNSDKSIKKENINWVLEKMEDSITGDASIAKTIWENIGEDLQKDINLAMQSKNENWFEEFINRIQENNEEVSNTWRKTTGGIQKEHINVLNKIIENNQVDKNGKINSKVIDELIFGTQHEALESAVVNIFTNEKIKNGTKCLIWTCMNEKIQEKNESILENIIENTKVNTGFVWRNTVETVQDSEIEKMINSNEITISKKTEIWSWTRPKIQQKHEEIVKQILAENPDNAEQLWRQTNEETQQKLLREIINDESISDLTKSRVWCGTSEEVQLRNQDLLFEVLEKFHDNVEHIWENTHIRSEVWKDVFQDKNIPDKSKAIIWINSEDMQLDNKDICMDLMKKNRDLYLEIWEHTNYEIKDELLLDVLNEFTENRGKIIDYTARNASSRFNSKPILIHNEYFVENIEEIYKFFPKDTVEKIKKLREKNEEIFATLKWDFIENNDYNFTDEQLLKVTAYPEIQEYLSRQADNKVVKDLINYLVSNDVNWILSLNRIFENEVEYKALILNLKQHPDLELTEEFRKQLLCVISDTDNYFEVESIKDIEVYANKRNNTCLKILSGNTDEIPEILKKYSKSDLYKFALLEYKLGISLKDANRLLRRYGEDADKISKIVAEKGLHEYYTASSYISTLKKIIESENIESIVSEMVKNNTLGEPMDISIDSRNIEGQVLNLFAELYNEKLYKPREEDKNQQQEIYIEPDGRKVEIPVYTLKDDFNMNIRVEGAYIDFQEPDNFMEYYNMPNIWAHGNCESYIGNDSIAAARNKNGVAVGYSVIGKNCLTSAGPFDLHSKNDRFSIYNENSQFRNTKEMIDNTRHSHNEMVKERVIVDENGEIVKYKPSYAVWIEETPQDKRDEEWKKAKEDDSSWKMTKKLAAQLGIPIIVIDREYFAKREMQKVQIIKNLILDIDAPEGLTIEEQSIYAECIEEYKKMSKPELLKEIFTKYENNRVGLHHNEDLCDMYFTQEQLNEISIDIKKHIEKLPINERKRCIEAMLEVANKEKSLVEKNDKETEKQKKRKSDIKDFYTDLSDDMYERIAEIEICDERNKRDTKEQNECIDYINSITETNFYEGNEHHSIEHIQKVILFSELLARETHLSDKDKKLLLVAAAYHDVGRQGLGDGNVEHAEESAEKAGKILRGEELRPYIWNN